jgi:uncharacterized protein YcfL
MRERLAAALLSLLVVACGAPFAELHETTLPSPDGQRPLPVRLIDTSQRVVSMEPELSDHAGSDEPTLTAVQGKPNAFVLSWIGGMCDSDVEIHFRPLESGFGLQFHTNANPGLGCPAAGIYRAIRVELTEPLSIEDIDIVPGT